MQRSRSIIKGVVAPGGNGSSRFGKIEGQYCAVEVALVEVYAAVRQFVFNDGKSRREAARVFALSWLNNAWNHDWRLRVVSY
jgi:hypothetical protein